MGPVASCGNVLKTEMGEFSHKFRRNTSLKNLLHEISKVKEKSELRRNPDLARRRESGEPAIG
jgi:hypothetical protein